MTIEKVVQGISAFRNFRNTDIFSFKSGGTITDGHTENEKIVADKIDDLLNIQFQPLSNGYNQYFFVRKLITEDLEDNDVNLDTDEISRLSFSIILTDSPDSDLRCEISGFCLLSFPQNERTLYVYILREVCLFFNF